MSRENQTVTIKVNGSFYVGDICYCLPDKVYYDVWDEKYNFEDGAFTDPETGLQFAVVSTAYGDGCYEGSNHFNYPVDAGNIGVVDMGLSDKPRQELDGDYGTIHTYTGNVNLTYDDGTIIVEFGGSRIIIETTEDDSNEYDDWYETEWEDIDDEEL